MPAITRSDLGALLEAGLRAEFLQAYNAGLQNTVYQQIASVIQTTLPTQKYAWLGGLPKMREFVDERILGQAKKYEYAISDKTWEATVAVERKAIEDDQLDAIRLRVRDLAAEAARHKDELIAGLLVDGFNRIGPDGQYFFDTDHGESDVHQSNKSATNAALSATSLADAISAMMLFTDDTGKPMGVVPDTLVVGPKLNWRARELLESTTIVTSSNVPPYKNVLQGALRLVVTPYITGYQWFVLDTSRPIRPVILQERSDVPVEFAALENANTSETVFLRDQLLFGVRARYGVGYGLWQLAYGSNATS